MPVQATSVPALNSWRMKYGEPPLPDSLRLVKKPIRSASSLATYDKVLSSSSPHGLQTALDFV